MFKKRKKNQTSPFIEEIALVVENRKKVHLLKKKKIKIAKGREILFTDNKKKLGKDNNGI